MATADMFSVSEFFFSRVSYKWNSTIYSLGSGFFHLPKGIEDLSMMGESIVCSFLSSVVFHCADVPLFIYLLAEGHWVVSIFWQL